MKRTGILRFPFYLFSILSISYASTTNAALVTPSDVITAYFDLRSESPSPPYDVLKYWIRFGSQEPLKADEGLSWQWFDGYGNPITNERSHITSVDATSIIFSADRTNPLSDGAGFLKIYPILATFDLYSVVISGGVRTGSCSRPGCGDDFTYEPTDWINPTSITITSAVPIPAAAWLFGSGLVGLVAMSRRKRAV